MTECTAQELRALADTAECRFYATALSQIACASEAYEIGDRKVAHAHIERAKTAYKRSMEVEADRVKRTVRDITARKSEAV